MSDDGFQTTHTHTIYIAQIGLHTHKWMKNDRTWWAKFQVSRNVSQNMSSGKYVLTLISENAVIHCLISRCQAVNYIRAAITNFCSTLPDDKWNVCVTTSEKLPSFLHCWILLTLMMYNSPELHLTYALNGSKNCLPKVMKENSKLYQRNWSWWFNLRCISSIYFH